MWHPSDECDRRTRIFARAIHHAERGGVAAHHRDQQIRGAITVDIPRLEVLDLTAQLHGVAGEGQAVTADVDVEVLTVLRGEVAPSVAVEVADHGSYEASPGVDQQGIDRGPSAAQGYGADRRGQALREDQVLEGVGIEEPRRQGLAPRRAVRANQERDARL